MAKRLVRVKLSLAHVRPRVWRAFDMYSTSTLGELHLAIQAVMPWEGYHLHEFVVDGASYVDRNSGWEDLDGDVEAYDQDSATLGAMIQSGFSRFEYVYDMGDDWTHRVELAAAGSAATDVAYPHLIAGARACPLEDSGGPRGHERLLRALSGDPQRDVYDEEDRQRLLEWAGDFDPKIFDAADAQSRLDMTFGNGPARAGGWGDWPEPFRLGERRRPGRAHEAAASLTRDLPAERFNNASFVTGAALMMRMLAEEPARATKTGALSIKTVLLLCDAMGIELRQPSLVRSEAEIPRIEILHELLDMAGLVL
ncbi:MAG: plasmid pRiA4b ORF-3 family protein, partial [Coriobacteriia bacterium]|nr:plasmid pRiA4b ORF-3 family protein [Coriobacteriia bacterium]